MPQRSNLANCRQGDRGLNRSGETSPFGSTHLNARLFLRLLLRLSLLCLSLLSLAPHIGCRSFTAEPVVERVSDSEAALLDLTGDGEPLPLALMVAMEHQLVKTRTIGGKVETLDLWKETKTLRGYRWRNQGLVDLADVKYLGKAMESTSPLVAATAAIGVSRRANRASPELVDVIRDARLPYSTRQAAVETLAMTASAETFDGVYEELSDPKNKSFSSKVYAELIMGLALQDAEPQDQRWLQALAGGNRDIKLAVLHGWERIGTGPLPDAARRLMTDPDGAVRGGAMRAFAACEGESHLTRVLDSVRDSNLTARLGAIRALGYIDAESSRAELGRLLKDRSTGIRAEAILALASLRDYSSVDQAVAVDASWRVRLSAVDSLEERNDSGAADLAVQLATDENPQVQSATLRAIRDWDLQASGPAYFHALGSTSAKARILAAEQLSQAWPTATLYSATAPAHQRREQLQMLRRVWPHGGLERR
jgi:HEAT repeat protein